MSSTVHTDAPLSEERPAKGDSDVDAEVVEKADSEVVEKVADDAEEEEPEDVRVFNAHHG